MLIIITKLTIEQLSWRIDIAIENISPREIIERIIYPVVVSFTQTHAGDSHPSTSQLGNSRGESKESSIFVVIVVVEETRNHAIKLELKYSTLICNYFHRQPKLAANG
jgi:hypothetical protein